MAENTLYDVLGVKSNAKMMEITRAYNRIVAEQQKEDAAPNPRMLAQAKVAFETLSNPDKRDEYDALLRKRVLMGKHEKHKPIKIGVAVVAALAALGFGYHLWHVHQLEEDARPKPMTPEALTAAVAPQLWHVQGALMSGEVRDLGTAIGVQEGKFITTCQGLAAGMVVTAKSGDDTSPAELIKTNDQLELCVFKVKGAKGGLKLRSEVPKGEPLQAIFTNANGKPETRLVSSAQSVKDDAGPALEVRSGAPLPNGTAVFDSFGNLVAIVVVPHPASEGSSFAISSGRIVLAKGTAADKQFVEAPPPPRNVGTDEPKAVEAPKIDDLGQPVGKGDPDKLRYTTRKEAQKIRDETVEKAISEMK